MSVHNLTRFKSLVDCGSNEGVSVEDVNVINTSPQIHFNIRGIDNHEITSVPIDTVGTLDHSNYGLVIIILNQYVYLGKGGDHSFLYAS